VTSAGTHPAGLNPGAVAVMQEIGIDISSHRSKRVDQYRDARFDYVVTVCDRAKETCPLFPAAASQLHWSLEDPASAQGSLEERLAVFRQVRDEIAERIRQLIDEEN
jgi:arsenate reductase